MRHFPNEDDTLTCIQQIEALKREQSAIMERYALEMSRKDAIIEKLREALTEAKDLMDDTAEGMLQNVTVERADDVWEKIVRALSPSQEAKP